MLGKDKNPKPKKITDLLNEAIAGELQATIQYMWQHILLVGKESAAISPILKQISIDEMKHAEMIAERLNYIGGEPVTKPAPVTLSGDIDEMLRQNSQSEENTVKLYRTIIEKAREDKDYATAILFEKILVDEEKHHDLFTKLLEK